MHVSDFFPFPHDYISTLMSAAKTGDMAATDRLYRVVASSRFQVLSHKMRICAVHGHLESISFFATRWRAGGLAPHSHAICFVADDASAQEMLDQAIAEDPQGGIRLFGGPGAYAARLACANGHRELSARIVLRDQEMLLPLTEIARYEGAFDYDGKCPRSREFDVDFDLGAHAPVYRELETKFGPPAIEARYYPSVGRIELLRYVRADEVFLITRGLSRLRFAQEIGMAAEQRSEFVIHARLCDNRPQVIKKLRNDGFGQLDTMIRELLARHPNGDYYNLSIGHSSEPLGGFWGTKVCGMVVRPYRCPGAPLDYGLFPLADGTDLCLYSMTSLTGPECDYLAKHSYLVALYDKFGAAVFPEQMQTLRPTIAGLETLESDNASGSVE